MINVSIEELAKEKRILRFEQKKWYKRIYFKCEACGREASRLLRTKLKKFKFVCNKRVTHMTSLKKYGVEHATKLEETQNKKRKTNFERYGVEYVLQFKNFKDKSRTIEKINETKRKNNTFNTSKTEDKAYKLLCENFDEVPRQYYDKKRYPFRCDFYISTLDLFVECQFSWMHGKCRFNAESLEHLTILAEWEIKSKNHPTYKNAISTWTVRDPLKRQTAKTNKLKYIEFFSLNDIVEFLKNKDSIYTEAGVSICLRQ